MSLLVDPTICPDCRAALVANTCTGCGLALVGPLASDLWRTMQVADGIVTQLRAAVPVTHPPLPTAPPVPVRPQPTRRLSAGSVPAVLFGVGATCLLVAALVFVAVAWSSLGLGARATLLLGVTAALAALATRLTRRGLRGAAETFWLVVGAMVTIDLGAAYGAGLLGYDDLNVRHATALVGAALLALGLGVASWSRRTELGALVSATVITAAGALLLSATEAWSAPHAAVATTLSVLLLAALAVACARAGLATTGIAVAALGAVSWFVLVLLGLDRATGVTAADWWRGAEGWPLLVAAGIAAAVALAVRLPEPVRTVGAAASEVTLVLLVLAPGAGVDAGIVLLCSIAVALAATAVLAPRVWALPATCLAGFALLLGGGFAVLTPLDALSGERTGSEQAPWTALVVALTVVLVALALTRRIAAGEGRTLAERTWWVGAPAVLALGAATVVLANEPALAVEVLAWSGVLVVLAAGASVVRGAFAPGVLVAAGYLGVVGLRLASPSHVLAGLLAAALAAGFAIAYRRIADEPVVRPFLAIATLVSAGFAAAHLPFVLGGTNDTAGISVVLLAAVAGVLAPRLTRSEDDRRIVEVVALVLGLVATQLPAHGDVVTVVLTLLGSAVALASVLHRDRDRLGWAATVVLGATALERVLEGVTAPELVTAPAAVLLLAAGGHRLLREPGTGSVRMLGSGLTLALLPSLVVVLDEPVSVRGALLPVLALAALALGVAQRWTAPFLAGAAVLAVLAVRHLGPAAEGLPRWISLGAVGALLLAVAISWESRRRELTVAERYLTALR